jgi:uncharacterized protein (TIGR03437 family)
MKSILPLFLLCLAAAPQARATVIALGQSNEKFTLTGLGVNASGLGQTRITWGSCAFDGTNTTCAVSGPFTGLDGGGTFKFVLTYQGNGPSPATLVYAPGSDRGALGLTSGSLVMTLTENSGATLSFYVTTNFFFQFLPGFTCTAVTDCRDGAVGAAPGSTITGFITGTFDTTPIIRGSQGVISAGDYGAFSAIAPGSWIEIFGFNLSTNLNRTWSGSDFDGDNAPTTLSGTTVTIAGQRAFIDFAGVGQINAQVPSNIPLGPQPVVVTTGGGSSLATTVTVNSVEPGLLASAPFKLAAGQYAVAVFAQDPLTFVLPTNALPVSSRRAKAGDVLTFYGIGFGHETPDIPAGVIVRQINTLQSQFSASFAGVPAAISYAGSVPGYLGLYQFNVTVPNIPASDAVPFTFSVGGTAGPQTLLIAVQ